MNVSLPPDYRILVVEDDYFIAQDMRLGLKRAGAHVVGPVATVREALELLSQGPIDAAVLDINLEADGKAFPVAEALRALEIPFVFATGYSATEIPEAFAFVRRFGKPCNAERILQVLLDLR